MPVRIAVIGCGAVATRYHLPAYAASDGVELAAVCCRTEATARSAAERFGARAVCTRWQDVLALPDVDAVDICVPNDLHQPIAVAAARAGKHVLVEKPMARTLPEAGAIIQAARESGVILMVAQNFRFSPLLRKARDLVAGGLIGRVAMVRGTFAHGGPEEWSEEARWFLDRERAGGGVLIDLGVHMADAMRWIIGGPAVEEVSAFTAPGGRGIPGEEAAVVTMRFADGAIGLFNSAWTVRPRAERSIAVYGDRGTIVAGGSWEDPLVAYVRDDDGEARVLRPEVPDAAARGGAYLHFADCVRRNSPPEVPGEEGRAALETILAAYRSAATGRAVRLPMAAAGGP